MSPASAPLDLLPTGEYARDWALVDVETSGLMARRDRVLSVAVITIGPDGEQTGEFSTLLGPGCDPGPVEVHGLTVERLRGAPSFDQVAERIGGMLQDRVLVAHNAQFDYDFLAHEFARARMWLPVSQRLCTLALNRQVDPPTDNMKLGTLAAHYGVPQQRAHDALDDTRVLAGILRASLREAAKLALPLPLVTCPPRAESTFTPKPPKTPCAYRNPGRMTPGGPLQQGMKVALTGETAHARAELVGRAVAVGLNMMTSVSRHTSVLVTNEPASGSAKAERALAENVPVIDENTFLRLLTDVRPGVVHEATAVVVVPVTESDAEQVMPVEQPVSSTAAAAPVTETPALPTNVPDVSDPAPPQPAPSGGHLGKPLAGRRVLVLGGAHAEAAAARTRVVELGGSAAVNLSVSVTDVVLLPGGEGDRRMSRITALGLPVQDRHWITAPTAAGPVEVGEAADAALRPQEPHVLPRGGVIDLPMPLGGPAPEWYVTAGWAPRSDCEVDVVAFLLDEDEQVTFDEDFIFYGAPESPAGTVRLLFGGPAEQTVALNLASLPPSTRKVVVAAAIDGDATFGTVGAIQVGAAPGSSGAPLARATLDAATTERTLLLAEFYRRGPLWRLRAVGQGYDHGLDALARAYGVDIAD
ncbi:TerD family protein [Streptomyces pseudovenezuelae]|uniref:DNA polymerase-3 subunit epsilon n=1 Tax=Streptomyces pseudovenezuelae TaxID=67350 RepID=A0ABT6LHK4_9ACTN|nr:TerD family protein [Streptomyces pseudovenezuelae]MDH6215793.1 DNA polymerase-3 subunit epsilon [Streptomyces pseudovenezuelae]